MGSQVLALFSALASVPLVTGHHLAAVQHGKLFGYGEEPASWCYTYFSCYLAALETPSNGYPFPGAGVVTTITSIVQQPTLFPTFPTPVLTTPLSGLPSLSPAPPLSVSSPSPVPSPLPGAVQVILAIVPAISGRMLEKRASAKRDLGGFISDVGSPNPKDCRSATVYRLDSGRLQESSRPSFSIFADAGTGFTEFRARDASNAGSNVVATTFLNDNSVLRWRNASFSGGEAGFCQVAVTGQVYSTFVDSPAQLPTGCLPVRLSILDPSQCVGGSTTAGSPPATTSITTDAGSTQSVGPSSGSISSPLVESSSSSLPQTTPRFTNTTTTRVPDSSESSSVPEPSSEASATESTETPSTFGSTASTQSSASTLSSDSAQSTSASESISASQSSTNIESSTSGPSTTSASSSDAEETGPDETGPQETNGPDETITSSSSSSASSTASVEP